jgi:hypothetical protein
MDFGKIIPIILTGVTTNPSTYTMEFWIYMNNNYGQPRFQYMEFQWQQQLKIRLEWNSTQLNYKATCYPFYDVNSITNTNLNSAFVYFDPVTNWAFIRCSVYVDILSYFITWNNNKYYVQSINGGTQPSVPDVTTIQIVGPVVDAGVIFIRQMRLWSCFNCAFNFNNSIMKSAITNFPNLLHAWDPYYDPVQSNEFRYPLTNTLSIKNSVNPNWVYNYPVVDTNYFLLALLNDTLTKSLSYIPEPTATSSPLKGVATNTPAPCNPGYYYFYNSTKELVSNYK